MRSEPHRVEPKITGNKGLFVELGRRIARLRNEQIWTQQQLAEQLGIVQHIERISQLPKPRQRFVMEMLDTVLAQASRNKENAMTRLQLTLNLPDELAQWAQGAGLLTPEALEGMLREQLKKRAGDELRAMWSRGPQEKLPPETDQEIVEDVRAVREERRKQTSS